MGDESLGGGVEQLTGPGGFAPAVLGGYSHSDPGIVSPEGGDNSPCGLGYSDCLGEVVLYSSLLVPISEVSQIPVNAHGCYAFQHGGFLGNRQAQSFASKSEGADPDVGLGEDRNGVGRQRYGFSASPSDGENEPTVDDLEAVAGDQLGLGGVGASGPVSSSDGFFPRGQDSSGSGYGAELIVGEAVVFA